MGSLFRNGKGAPRDYAEAAAWFEKAAKQDHVKSLNALAYLNRKGLGVEADFVKARDLYCR